MKFIRPEVALFRHLDFGLINAFSNNFECTEKNIDHLNYLINTSQLKY